MEKGLSKANKAKIINTNLVTGSSSNRARKLTALTKNLHVDYITKSMMDTLKDELLQWAYSVVADMNEKSTIKTIQTFLNAKRIRPSSWDNWRVKYPDLVVAENDARRILSEQHRYLATHGICNAGSIERTMTVYSKDHYQAKQLEAELKAKAEASQAPNILVGIPTYTYKSIENKEETKPNVIDTDDEQSDS